MEGAPRAFTMEAFARGRGDRARRVRLRQPRLYLAGAIGVRRRVPPRRRGIGAQPIAGNKRRLPDGKDAEPAASIAPVYFMPGDFCGYGNRGRRPAPALSNDHSGCRGPRGVHHDFV